MKYKQRVRSRVSNLRDAKNPLLKVKVLSGDISPERFASMPTEVRLRVMVQIISIIIH